MCVTVKDVTYPRSKRLIVINLYLLNLNYVSTQLTGSAHFNPLN